MGKCASGKYASEQIRLGSNATWGKYASGKHAAGKETLDKEALGEEALRCPSQLMRARRVQFNGHVRAWARTSSNGPVDVSSYAPELKRVHHTRPSSFACELTRTRGRELKRSSSNAPACVRAHTRLSSQVHGVGVPASASSSTSASARDVGVLASLRRRPCDAGVPASASASASRRSRSSVGLGIGLLASASRRRLRRWPRDVLGLGLSSSASASRRRRPGVGLGSRLEASSPETSTDCNSVTYLARTVKNT